MPRARSRTLALVGAIGATATLASMTLLSASGSAGASATPAQVRLAGSIAPFTSHTQAIGTAAAGQELSIQVWLRPRVAAAESFATAVSTPGGKLFRHYLSPDSYTSRFGATTNEATKVEKWLRTQGFTSIRADSQRSYVRATASTATIDKAFATQLKLYKSTPQVNAGPNVLRANSEPISIPGSLASSVLGVTGLDNAAPILPLDTLAARPVSGSAPKAAASVNFPCSHYYGQHVATGLPQHFGTTSFPSNVCGYTAAQIRAAYEITNANASAGQGQTIALVELGLTQDMLLTLQDYAAANHLPAPSAQRYSELSLGQGTACGDAFDVEEQLDVEASYAMAPAAKQIVVGGDTCNDGDFGLQGLFDADIAVLDGANNHPLASVASNSWEGFDEGQAAYLTDIEHAYLLQAAAEGVGMYFSAGDLSGVEAPGDDPYATAVGGTTLGIGKTNNRLFETGWSTGEYDAQNNVWVTEGEQAASSGGPSVLWKEPAYQRNVVPAAMVKAPGNRGGTVRSTPDISADADPFTGFAVGLLTFNTKDPSAPPTYSESDVGGTSISAPLVAGIVISAQQGQHGSFGLINPAIYRLANTSAVHDALPLTSHSPTAYRGTACPASACLALSLASFDDQDPNMFGYTGQVSVKGYDNMSGIGTPNGQNFIKALRRLEK